jgi:hypothetical protein
MSDVNLDFDKELIRPVLGERRDIGGIALFQGGERVNELVAFESKAGRGGPGQIAVAPIHRTRPVESRPGCTGHIDHDYARSRRPHKECAGSDQQDHGDQGRDPDSATLAHIECQPLN